MNNLETKVRVANAYHAMEILGISEDKVKPVLKNLLKLFDKNWMHIEEENYRALADAIFEREELQAAEQSKKVINAQTKDNLDEEAQATEEPETERPLKRLRRRHQDSQTSNISALDEVAQATEVPERPLKGLRRHQDVQTSGTSTDGKRKPSLVIPKEEPDELPETNVPRLNGPKSIVESSQSKSPSTAANSQLITYQSRRRNKGKQPVCSKPLTIIERCDMSQPSSVSNSQPNTQLRTEPSPQTHPIRPRDKGKGDVSVQIPSREKEPVSDSSTLTVSLKEPKVEPGIFLSPEKKSTRARALIKPKDEPVTDDVPSLNDPDTLNGGNTSLSIAENNNPGPLALQTFGEEIEDGTRTLNEPINDGELPMTSCERYSKVQLASSPSGEVKITLISSLAPGRSDFQMPNLEVVLKRVEDKCFKSPRTSGTNISVMTIMKEICECFLKSGNDSSSQSPKAPMVVSPTIESVSKSSAIDAPSAAAVSTSSLNSLVDSQSGAKLPESQIPVTPLPCSGMNDDGPQLNEMDAREGLNRPVESHSGAMLSDSQMPLPPPPCNGINDDGPQLNEMDAGEGLNDLVDSQSGAKLPEPQAPVILPPCIGLNDDGPQLNEMDAGDGLNRLVDSQSAAMLHEPQMSLPPPPCDGINDDEPQLNEMDAGDGLNDLVDSQTGAKLPEPQTPVTPPPCNGLNDNWPQLNRMDAGDGLNGLVNSQSSTKLSESQMPIHPPPCDGMDDDVPQLNEVDAGDGLNGLVDSQSGAKLPETQMSIPSPPCNDTNDDWPQPTDMDAGHGIVRYGEKNKSCAEDKNALSIMVVQHPQVTPEVLSSLHDAFDIAKGQEKVLITLLNEVNDEVPPSFFYIPQNAVFENAFVNFSLARISDNNCCATCPEDCLSSSTPCACTHETGGEFAYTSDGLVREGFLEECISMNQNPTKHCQFFCKKCPLEKSKCEDITEPCKGHLVRKFIKECWCKCSCSIQCGNRVVQRGIGRRLQVFMTPEAKGWGLRTLEDLPQGAFVCEYVGEVLTNRELFERVFRSPEGENHSYPVLLDADWSAEGVLKDEEALCLDSTYYGNVARFINHRCYDSNLVEIPVEVETPDHHYYHLAFFTARKVKAMEELTWDYGIDFDDEEHPIKAFRCRCGSKFCRNIKRYRSRGSRR